MTSEAQNMEVDGGDSTVSLFDSVRFPLLRTHKEGNMEADVLSPYYFELKYRAQDRPSIFIQYI